VWNESFTFDINLGTEPLFLEVMDKDTFGQDDSEGVCFVSLNDPRLIEQQKADMWFDLQNKENKNEI